MTEVDSTRAVNLKHLVSTTYLVSKTGISKSQIHRIVTELNTLGLIDIHKAGSRHENHMVFKSEFDWVYERPFQDLLEKCYPSKPDTDTDTQGDTQGGEQT